ncbi:hypothetical protein [Actinomadura rubrisoli]|uniref:Uncharacterized protein n=1 Tax=Actinomadura rubrisoli TaxID=2530368 RepID=A0A4R5BJJ0_9ACTN|nr:hypothetical protein [Actinomadura rubrisoli]TDD86801.1 hypothetical protein E1298_16865 [Actinomadura rubrisoli]
MTAMAPWTAAELQPDRVIAELGRRFPGTCAWWGEYTGAWWAISRDGTGRHRLIEADDPAELGRRLEALGARHRPALARPVTQTGTARRLRQPPPAPRRAVPFPAAPGWAEPAPRRGWLRRLFRR